MQIDNREVFATASVGIACSYTGYANATDVLRDATIAMWRARSQSSVQYALFNPDVETADPERFAWESELRWATARREFCLHYQPIVHLQDGQPLGFEALVRWQHPHRGLVLPSHFVELAEELGLISELGWQVLELAVQQLHEWQQVFPTKALFVNVNLSVLQLQQTDFVERLAALLTEYELPGDRLHLELTESCFLSSAAKNLIVLRQVKALGVALCIDDFGVGFSSLSRLLDFPVDCLKIDRGFVSRITDSSGRAIIQSILTLARNLGIDAIAEGIESTVQAEQLRALDCRFGQGYYLARPLRASDATDYCHQYCPVSQPLAD
ncbi:MAG: EAL domain-containing protein [Spirulinaceae cyanobacterium RM2_2_10]|nr:EAL domain-containing protein [Spirulinaceae cyanobacterium RM2_2_10]